METPIKKVCTWCKEEKPLSEFGKHIRGKNGKRSVCKKCECEKQKQYEKNNSVKIKAKRRQRIESGRNATACKKYYRKNHEQLREYAKNYYKQHKDKRKDYLLSSKERIKVYKKLYRLQPNNKIKDNLLKNLWSERTIRELRDNYIKKLLRKQGYPIDAINKDLIEIKKFLIKIKRHVKENKKANKQPSRTKVQTR